MTIVVGAKHTGGKAVEDVTGIIDALARDAALNAAVEAAEEEEEIEERTRRSRYRRRSEDEPRVALSGAFPKGRAIPVPRGSSRSPSEDEARWTWR